MSIFLALDMSRIVSALFLSFFLLSCNDHEDSDSPLSRPPYDKLTDSIEKAPSAELYYRRGVLLYKNNQPVFAEKDIRNAWQLDPKEEFALGMSTLLTSKTVDSAIVFLQDALKKLPSSIPLQLALARGFQQKKQWEKAVSICDKILLQFPNAVDALLLKAEILKEENKDPEALATLEKAYLYAPGDVELVHTLAFDYAEAKNPKVIVIADSLIKADVQGSHAEPYYFKGVYYSNIGKPQEAIRQFDEAIRHNYNFMNAYINKGIIFYEQKKYDQALKTFALANTVSPDLADPYYWTAKTQEAMGNKQEAKINYQRAYGLDKTMTEAKDAADRL